MNLNIDSARIWKNIIIKPQKGAKHLKGIEVVIKHQHDHQQQLISKWREFT